MDEADRKEFNSIQSSVFAIEGQLEQGQEFYQEGEKHGMKPITPDRRKELESVVEDLNERLAKLTAE